MYIKFNGAFSDLLAQFNKVHTTDSWSKEKLPYDEIRFTQKNILDALIITLEHIIYESDKMHGGRGGVWPSPFCKLHTKRKVDPMEPPKSISQIEAEIAAEKKFLTQIIHDLGAALSSEEEVQKWKDNIEG